MSTIEFIAVLIIGILNVQLLELPRDLNRLVGPDGWVVVLLLTIWGLLILTIAQSISARFPGKSLVGVLKALLTKPVGWLVGAAFATYWILDTARVVRMSSGMIKAQLLDRTPTEVIVITLLLGALFLARRGIEPLARMGMFIALGALSIVFLLPILTWMETNWLNLKPVLFGGPWEELRVSLPFMGRINGLLFLMVLFPFVDAKKKEKRIIAPVVGLSAAAVGLTLQLFTTAVFGVKETTSLLRPGLQIVQSIEMPTIFVERLTVFYVGAWVLLVLMNLSIHLYVLSIVVGDLLSVKSSTPIGGFLLPIIIMIARAPQNEAAVRLWDQRLTLVNTGLFALVPLLYIIVRIRGIKAAKEESGS